MLPSNHFCRLNLLIIFDQNLPIRDENDYNFGKIRLVYCIFTRFSMKSTCNHSSVLDINNYTFKIIEPVDQVLGKVKMNAL